MKRLVFIIFLMALPASAATPQPHLLGLSITADDRATSLEIDLSSRAPLSTVVKPDRIEIDLPTAQWDRSLPAKGKGGGVIDSYRKVPAAHGIAIVLHTNTRVKIDSSEGQPDEAGGQHITIRLVPEVDTYGVVQPTVLYAAPAAGPVVQEVTGAGVETLPAQAVQNATSQPRLSQALKTQAAAPSNGCTSHLVQNGRIGDPGMGSYPVYKFSDCP
jgi:hypothetical protein